MNQHSHNYHNNNHHHDDDSSSEDPLMHADDESSHNNNEEGPIDDLDRWNPDDPAYTPPELHKGTLQIFMEDEMTPSDARSYVYMLVQAQFPEWSVARKTPYYENESKEMKDKKPRGHYTLFVGKRILVQEIKRRDSRLGRNKKNKSFSMLFEELMQLPLQDPRDVLYVKYRERELRSIVGAFVQRRMEFEQQKAAGVVTAGNRRVQTDGEGNTTTTNAAANESNATPRGSLAPANRRNVSSVIATQVTVGIPPPRRMQDPLQSSNYNASTLEQLLVEVRQLSQAVTQIAETMAAPRVSQTQIHKELTALQKEKRELQIVCAREPDPGVKRTLFRLVEEMEEEIVELKKRQRVDAAE